jgi:hypothetical protein
MIVLLPAIPISNKFAYLSCIPFHEIYIMNYISLLLICQGFILEGDVLGGKQLRKKDS